MGKDTLDTTLVRIDPAQNMARYYSMTIQQNLFGEASLMRNWGRIGSGGQMRIDLFHDEKEARAAHDLLLTTKMKRGYARL